MILFHLACLSFMDRYVGLTEPPLNVGRARIIITSVYTRIELCVSGKLNCSGVRLCGAFCGYLATADLLLYLSRCFVNGYRL